VDEDEKKHVALLLCLIGDELAEKTEKSGWNLSVLAEWKKVKVEREKPVDRNEYGTDG
jgi:hypothetical protein